MKIETDSKTVEEVKDPESCNVFQLFQCFADQSAQQDLAEQYRVGGMGYGTAKQICFEAIRDELKEASEHYHQIRGDHAHLEGILEGGKDKARKLPGMWLTGCATRSVFKKIQSENVLL